jgi:hypothetical protein
MSVVFSGLGSLRESIARHYGADHQVRESDLDFDDAASGGFFFRERGVHFIFSSAMCGVSPLGKNHPKSKLLQRKKRNERGYQKKETRA